MEIIMEKAVLNFLKKKNSTILTVSLIRSGGG